MKKITGKTTYKSLNYKKIKIRSDHSQSEQVNKMLEEKLDLTHVEVEGLRVGQRYDLREQAKVKLRSLDIRD